MKQILLILLIVVTCLLPSPGRGRFSIIGDRKNNAGEFPYVKDSTKAFDFQFVNAGDSLLTIIKVIPGCTCMKATWSRESLAPGDTGYIHVDYHVKRPGHFNNILTVLGDGSPEWDYLYVEGTAIEDPDNK